MVNDCHFSPDRRHRYTLLHRINPLFGEKLIMWIGLNPSTADEQKLDPTLTRIRSFSEREGYDGFLMTNIFGFRATDPKEMQRATDPIGPENDQALLAAAERCDRVVAAWGAHGVHQDRALAVAKLLSRHTLWCLGTTKDGFPRHPLYIKGDQPLVRWKPLVASRI
ncbi:MAG: DUF1643 domain-containing protein [Cephaloticoccus sp.]|nr:DUF1643 domain-containing protein [Cephaloticoccus sp.]MCF7759218.1 DUF1643 domain-containing protein [Cephaloticoccus sp.]